MDSVLKSRSARVLSVVLILQAALFYGFSRAEKIPAHKPLQNFEIPSDDWHVVEELQLDNDSLQVLKADDILSRLYQNTKGQQATLFVAFFETQRTGKAPHSPKNCLPGAGWVPSQSGAMDISVPGEKEPI